MVNDSQLSSPGAIRCRQITDADREAVINLLKKGFGARRSREFWTSMFNGLAQCPVPPGVPKFGYLLESDGRLVGVILMIFSTVRAAGETSVRCNLSSWYVEPEFRSYASLLVSHAMKRKDVTYLNISPAPHTWPALAAQGYSRYSNGLFVSIPVLSAAPAGAVRVIAANDMFGDRARSVDRDLLLTHADYGCISLWCATKDDAHPFVFVPRAVKGLLPCFQLVYCRDIADFVRFARPLGRYLALRRRPLVIVDANGPIRGLVGWYFDGMQPKYFKGPNSPRLGDLSYTEAAMFGI